jgi:hypothetical protein
MSRLVLKRCKITPSGNDKSGPACINVENRAHAAPIDSSFCSKSRIALDRETIRDMGKNARQNLSLISSKENIRIELVEGREDSYSFRV